MTSSNAQQRLLVEELRKIKISSLSLTPHSRAPLRRIIGAAEYYLDIYRNCLDKVLEMCQSGPANLTVVDFGGGHGILSIFAKRLGFGRVVYVDNHPDSLATVRALSERLDTAPDAVLQGDAATLQKWCEEQQVRPDALLALDVIEHVYVLDEFFASLHSISPRMPIIFTTGSTPFNKRVVRRLHRVMQKDEQGTTGKKGFCEMRRDYILQNNPEMPERQLDYWAENTRGLVFDDVKRAVESQSPNLLLDPFNTCDPLTGSWTERILPVEDYLHLLQPYGYSLTVLPGRYNDYRRGVKGMMSRKYNKTIDKAPVLQRTDTQSAVLVQPERRRERRAYRKALKIAPFIYMIAESTSA